MCSLKGKNLDNLFTGTCYKRKMTMKLDTHLTSNWNYTVYVSAELARKG